MRNQTEADKKFAEIFIGEYLNKSKKFINAKPRTYSRIVQSGNYKERLINFLDHFHNQEIQIAYLKQPLYEQFFEYSRKIHSYVKDGETIAYVELTKIINPYESKFPAYEFINLDKNKNLLEALQNKMIYIFAEAQKGEPDKISSQGEFIEEVLLEKEFVFDVFSNLKNCERLLPEQYRK